MTIIFATDFSAYADEAAGVAAELASAWNVPLHVVHVSEDARAPFVIGTSEERLLSDELRSLAKVAERLVRETSVQVTTELGAGAIEDCLATLAERHVAELLVVGLEPVSARAEGGLTERLLGKAKVPVLAVRSADRLRAFLRGERPLRVLLGSDLKAAALHAEASLAPFARLGALQVEVVCVTSLREAQVRYGLQETADVAALEAMAEPLYTRALRAHGANFPWRDQRRVRVLFGERSPEAALAELAQDADLVALGARKHGWLTRAFGGSAAVGVLRASPHSVLCVPADLSHAKVVPAARFRRVVAATDFSPQGDAALSAAFSLVSEGGALHFVHVMSGLEYDDPIRREATRRQLWARVPPDTAGREVQAEVLAGPIDEALILYARRVGADALCVGSHGHSQFASRALGSTSRALVARAEVPVLVVPPVPE